jgi:hypothetical protein
MNNNNINLNNPKTKKPTVSLNSILSSSSNYNIKNGPPKTSKNLAEYTFSNPAPKTIVLNKKNNSILNNKKKPLSNINIYNPSKKSFAKNQQELNNKV